MATISDVAQYAGVSRSTVSHALSGKRPISRETRERVNDAICALHYTANAGAKALATSKSSVMGLIVPFNPEEFAPATMQYVLIISETARSLGYDVMMVTGAEGAAGIARVTDSNMVDGVILLDVKRHDERIDSIVSAGKPGVLVGIAEDNHVVDSVDLDYAHAASVLIRHLHSEGHRHVIFLTFPEDLFAEDLGFVWRFYDSVIAVANELGIELEVVHGDPEPAARARVVAGALRAHPEATALLVHNEGALVDLPLLLKECGLSAPDDISVVSVFPDQFGGMFSLPYTAIETSPKVVAERAVRMLANRIANPDHPVLRELIAPVLIDRGSTRDV
ncbi:MAG TPA: LacI family DNA-binding transcriptional regulator [Galbitalea sp.]|jgi:DNA-binding LacI/PurR family transcriptional regulator|nr:LacI family DNA-binding transcriptional regulator [Galbitalea sp.]